MKNFNKKSLVEGITYTHQQNRLFRESVIRDLCYNYGFLKNIVIQLREVSNGIMICDLSYHPKKTVYKNEIEYIIRGLFRDIHAPNFWEIKLLYLIHFHSTGEGGYVGMCGNIIYEKDDYDPSTYPDDPGFERHRIFDQLFTTHELFEVLDKGYGSWRN